MNLTNITTSDYIFCASRVILYISFVPYNFNRLRKIEDTNGVIRIRETTQGQKDRETTQGLKDTNRVIRVRETTQELKDRETTQGLVSRSF
jgi:hypothetical protein